MPNKFLHKPEPGRECGDCTACCAALVVPELAKGMWQPCKHCAAGCTIYETRPASCKTYECLWRAGIFGKDIQQRPDKLGVLLEFQQSPKVGPTIVARESREGGSKESKAEYLLGRMAHYCLVYVFHHNSTKRTIMGPEEILRKVGRVNEVNAP